MARPAKGMDVLEQAKSGIASARTVEELRAAQALLAYANDPERVRSITPWNWVINAL